MIRFGKKGGLSEFPDMTPMIDMLFILLVFFLITSYFISPVFNVNPPESDTAEETAKSDLIIEVDSEGSFSLDGEHYSPDAFEKEVFLRLAQRNTGEVYIRADRDTDFHYVVSAVDILKKAGADEIGFIVQKK